MNRIIAAAVAAALAPLAAAQTFATSRTAAMPQVAGAYYDLCTGDVDGDGDLDLVLANDIYDNYLFLNDGRGNFVNGTAGRLVTPAGHATYEADLADIDGDGDLDLLMVNDDFYPNLVYRNNGAGVFTDISATALPANADYSTDQVVADFDGDGDVDWFDGNAFGPSRLYLNQGNGTFVDGTTGRLPGTCPADYRSLAADLDGDGDLDLILNRGGNYLSGAPTILINNGAATFTTLALTLGNGLAYAADLDGDGRLDLLDNSGQRWRRNLGGLTFGAPVNVSFPTNPTFAAFDADGDGDQDLLGSSRLYLNDGTGAFPVSIAHGMLYAGNSPCLADLDDDGDQDLVSAFSASSGSVYFNQLTQLRAPSAPRIGTTYTLEFVADTSNGAVAFFPAVSLADGFLPLPGLGNLRLSPTLGAMLPPVFTFGPPATLTFTLPNDPAFVGLVLYYQSAVQPANAAPSLTNALRDVVGA
ncbi:MAG: hypothetical protein RL398_2815 [Planctomycetota bacterium]